MWWPRWTSNFYPLTGNFIKDQGYLFIDCSNQGVECLETRVYGKLAEIFYQGVLSWIWGSNLKFDLKSAFVYENLGKTLTSILNYRGLKFEVLTWNPRLFMKCKRKNFNWPSLSLCDFFFKINLLVTLIRNIKIWWTCRYGKPKNVFIQFMSCVYMKYNN